jgi:allantoate deiminase
MNVALAGVPIDMLFVRSIGGVSHSPAEYSRDEDCTQAARVLAAAALELAGEPK